jgi:hypothetical protein
MPVHGFDLLTNVSIFFYIFVNESVGVRTQEDPRPTSECVLRAP